MMKNMKLKLFPEGRGGHVTGHVTGPVTGPVTGHVTGQRFLCVCFLNLGVKLLLHSQAPSSS